MNRTVEFEGRILVADDERVNVEFFQVMLSKLGFTVEVASNGEEVLKKVPVFHPDVLLMDLIIPKVNGFQVARHLKQNPSTSDIPIIVLTSIRDIDKKVEMLEMGIDEYVMKPYNFIEILARIRSALRQKRMREELLLNRERLAGFDRFEETLHRFICDAREDSQGMLDLLKEHLGAPTGPEACRGPEVLQAAFERGKRLLEHIDNLELSYAELMR